MEKQEGGRGKEVNARTRNKKKVHFNIPLIGGGMDNSSIDGYNCAIIQTIEWTIIQ